MIAASCGAGRVYSNVHPYRALTPNPKSPPLAVKFVSHFVTLNSLVRSSWCLYWSVWCMRLITLSLNVVITSSCDTLSSVH